jgi:hypothetical protein
VALSGAIADRAKAIIPITWDALSRDTRVGDAPLQSAIDLAKETVTGANIATNQEDTYPVLVVDYIAKLAVIEICKAGVDFWMNQSTSVTTTGTNESLTYTDRANVLDKLRQELLEETRLKKPEIEKLVGYAIDNGRSVPQLSSATINNYHLTPSPEEFPRPFRQTQYS